LPIYALGKFLPTDATNTPTGVVPALLTIALRLTGHTLAISVTEHPVSALGTCFDISVSTTTLSIAYVYGAWVVVVAVDVASRLAVANSTTVVVHGTGVSIITEAEIGHVLASLVGIAGIVCTIVLVIADKFVLPR